MAASITLPVDVTIRYRWKVANELEEVQAFRDRRSIAGADPVELQLWDTLIAKLEVDFEHGSTA